jgi:hypothetical protein
MIITSPNVSTCLRFAPCEDESDSATTSSDKSMTPSVVCTSLRLFVPRAGAGRDIGSRPSLVKSMPAISGSEASPATADCPFARPLPLEEARFTAVVVVAVVDALALFVDEGCEGDAERDDGGGGGGLA